MIIGFFGLSGVGKTFLINKIMSNTYEFEHISASELIKLEGGIINYQRLDKKILFNNQKKLLTAIKKLDYNKKYLIELHTILEYQTHIFDIPDFILQELSKLIDITFFLTSPADFILQNRLLDTKIRAIKNEVEIKCLQNRALKLFNKFFEKNQEQIITHTFEYDDLFLSIKDNF